MSHELIISPHSGDSDSGSERPGPVDFGNLDSDLVLYLEHMPRGQQYWRCKNGLARPVSSLILRRDFPGNTEGFESWIRLVKNEYYIPPSFAAPPFVLPGGFPYDETTNPLPPPANIIRCLSGDINLESGRIEPHDPRYIATAVIPHRLNPSARAPVFSRFLRQLVPDEGQRRFLLEYFGYCLVFDNSRKKFLCLIGPKDSGKSVLIDAFENVVGSNNCCHLGLQPLASPFGPINTLGKPVNISSEEAWPSRAQCATVKAITGGDTIPMEVKHGPILSARPTIRLINVSNDQVHFPDKYIWERVAIINCGESVPRDHQDFRLREKLRAEAEGIFNILVVSAFNLYRRGDFEVVPSMVAGNEAAQRYSDHVIEFCESCFELAPDELLAEADIVEAYGYYCRDGNYRPAATIDVIREQLRQQYGLDRKRHRMRVDGQRIPALKGIRLVRYQGKKGRIVQRAFMIEEATRAALAAAKAERCTAEAAALRAEEALRSARATDRAIRAAEQHTADRDQIDEIAEANRENKKARTRATKAVTKAAGLVEDAARKLAESNQKLDRAIKKPATALPPDEVLLPDDGNDPELQQLLDRLTEGNDCSDDCIEPDGDSHE